jgi:hypothetical protein
VVGEVVIYRKGQRLLVGCRQPEAPVRLKRSSDMPCEEKLSYRLVLGQRSLLTGRQKPEFRVKSYRSVGPIGGREFETRRTRTTRPVNHRLDELTSQPLSPGVRRHPHAPQPGHPWTIPMEIPARHSEPLVAVGGDEYGTHGLTPCAPQCDRLPLPEIATPLPLKRRPERKRSVPECS